MAAPLLVLAGLSSVNQHKAIATSTQLYYVHDLQTFKHFFLRSFSLYLQSKAGLVFQKPFYLQRYAYGEQEIHRRCDTNPPFQTIEYPSPLSMPNPR